MGLAIIISASVMAFVSAFVLFKLAERNDRDTDKFSKQINVGFQLLMFFMLFASLFLVGKAGFDARDNCEFVLSDVYESYQYGNNFSAYHWDGYDGASVAPVQVDRDAFLFHKNITNTYEYICETNDNMTASWTYRLPLWLFRIGGFILLLYALNYLIRQIKLLFGDKRDDD